MLNSRRFLILNLIGYAALFAVNAFHVPWTSQGEEAKRLLFARETTYPIVAAQMAATLYLFTLYFLEAGVARLLRCERLAVAADPAAHLGRTRVWNISLCAEPAPLTGAARYGPQRHPCDPVRAALFTLLAEATRRSRALGSPALR